MGLLDNVLKSAGQQTETPGLLGKLMHVAVKAEAELERLQAEGSHEQAEAKKVHVHAIVAAGLHDMMEAHGALTDGLRENLRAVADKA